MTSAAQPPPAAGNLTIMQLLTAYTLEVNAPESIAGNRGVPSIVQPPSAAGMMPGTATESLGNTAVEYNIAPRQPNHGRRRPSSAHSALGSEIRDEDRSRSPRSSEDTLTFSPDAPAPEARRQSPRVPARPGSAKRPAMAASPPGRRVRKASSSPGGPFRPASSEAPPRDRAPLRTDRPPQSLEERQANTEKAISEHTRMGLELRRELFSKFSNVETVIEEKVASIEG